jgi:hypothetical protein
MTLRLRNVFLAAAAAVIGIALAATSLRMGSADWFSSRSAQAMAEWSEGKSRPDFESWLSVREGLIRADLLEPGNPRVLESLGLLHAGREAPAGSDRSGFQQQARDYFRQAAAARPTSPYTWANLAMVKYRIGETDPEFLDALRLAARYGPWEWEVQAIVADLGLAMLPELSAGDRSMVERMVANGIKRNPAAILRIAQRRGSLSSGCKVLDREAKGIDPKLVLLCDERGIR